jgi:hypothetical protein
MFSEIEKPKPAAAPSNAPYLRLGIVFQMKMATMIMIRPLNTSSVTGATRARRVQSVAGMPAAICVTNERAKLRVADKIRATNRPFFRKALEIPCLPYSRLVRFVLILGKKFVDGP